MPMLHPIRTLHVNLYISNQYNTIHTNLSSREIRAGIHIMIAGIDYFQLPSIRCRLRKISEEAIEPNRMKQKFGHKAYNIRNS